MGVVTLENQTELLVQMMDIAEQNIHHFKTDFVCIDVPRIVREWGNFTKLYWFIRDTGTHLYIQYGNRLIKDETDLLELYASYNDRMYIYNFGDDMIHEVDINAYRERRF